MQSVCLLKSLIIHLPERIQDLNALMKMKQTLGSLVLGVLQKLNVKFLFVPESSGNLVQQIWSAPYVRPVSVMVPCVWLGCKAACVRGGNDRHRKGKLRTLRLFLIVQWETRELLARRAACWLEEGIDQQGWQAKCGLLWSDRRGSNLEEPRIRGETQSPEKWILFVPLRGLLGKPKRAFHGIYRRVLVSE